MLKSRFQKMIAITLASSTLLAGVVITIPLIANSPLTVAASTKTNKQALLKVIRRAQAVQGKYYTAASFNSMQKVLKTVVNNTYHNPNAPQKQVNTAASWLNASLSHLVWAKKATPAVSTMNLAQIKAGNYSSISGKWQVVASYARGWAYGSDVDPAGLAITNNSLFSKYNGFTIKNNTLTDNAGKHGLTNITRNGMLEQQLTNQDAAINWSVSYYPKGSSNINHDFTFNNNVKFGTSRDLIVVWTSNNSFTEIFARK